MLPDTGSCLVHGMHLPDSCLNFAMHTTQPSIVPLVTAVVPFSWQDLLDISTLFYTRMFISESSQTLLLQTCLAGNLQPDPRNRQ
jgi:hypothetical protein